ncbi:hypothetical protein ACFLV3_02355 [Chloroflexota bacterium]
MLEGIVGFFVSGFFYSGIQWTSLLIGIGLALAFGAVWFVSYWTPLLKKPWAWAVLIGSAVLTWSAASFIQIPLQVLVGQVLGHFWSREVLMSWIFLAAIPQVLLSGLVQEGAKIVPVVIYWWRSGKNIAPKLGLAIGAVAGVGFGIFEAQWAHNLVLASGWTWEAVQLGGVASLAPFWERFFVIAFHTASCALLGWGLAKGWGWQFYLLASFLHGFINYSAVLFQTGIFTSIYVEIFVAVWALLVTGAVLWLRWRRTAEFDESEVIVD